ncbi:MAG: DUF11 domain-containing protein [Pirellulales bacterium]|nr:DUF11 domain-containing protein [Pirellulales bacterium]
MSDPQLLRCTPNNRTNRACLLRWWRLASIALGTLALCSCRSLPSALQDEDIPPMSGSSFAGDALSSMPHPPVGAIPSGSAMRLPQTPSGMDIVSMYGMRPLQAPPEANVKADGTIPVSYWENESEPSPAAENVTGLPFDPTLGYPPNPYAPMVPGIPLPQQAYSGWAPPGIAKPWPEIEYLRDGGDRYAPVSVDQNWNVSGLETEDTIAHYDTTDGLVHVEPSNRVHIYAPRFAAVRSVTSSVRNDQVVRMDKFRSQQQIVGVENNQLVTTHLQQEQLHADIGSSHVEGFDRLQYQDIYSRAQIAGEFSDRYLPYEDLSIIRQGIHQQTDQARLSAGMDAAVTWSHDTALQVVLNDVAATISENVQAAEVLYTVNSAPGPAKLRIVKVASTNYAKPGEVIDFTIRFDNVGAQVIGNVTIIDNLTTRLEYVEGSAQSSLTGEFFSTPNEGESLRLRWEIADPLLQGKGGVIRFQCRVR